MFSSYGLIAVLILALINAQFALTENEYFPGLRKPPQTQQISDYVEYLQWKNGFDEQARRRFLQQRQQHPILQSNDMLMEEIAGPGFTYKLPLLTDLPNDDMPPFAVGPGHPKYYERNEDAASDQSDTYKSVSNFADTELMAPVRLSSDGIPSYKIKAPMNVNPKISTYNDVLSSVPSDNSFEVSKSKDVYSREDLRKLIENLDANDKENEIANLLQSNSEKLQADVEKQPVDLDSAWVIGVIAGVSAAVTVGLLAIGIGWYTLQKKAKAAADVDYPAYGITGPNKDFSPSSGDRRLAQCAQMYHYQHQKQQIIAMENQHNDQNGSDIDTDDDNEEGDYTVYECPGLAPTGDMEVKNPLFLDDPTPPVQKGTIIIKPNQKLPSHLEYSHHEQNLQFRIQECDDGRLNNSETVSEK